MTQKNEKLNLLIIGTGVYVCGRGTEGYGTILPAVLQAYKEDRIERLLVASRDIRSFSVFEEKLLDLSKALDVVVTYEKYPSTAEPDDKAYRKALSDLPDPGAVIIVTPDHTHYEMAQAAIEAEKHLLVVKPLTPTVAQTRLLIKAADEARIYGAVEFHKRWDWANLQLRAAIVEQTIGEPLYFHIEYSQRKVIPTQSFVAWVEQTSIFQYLGVHYVDLIYFATGARPLRLLATGQMKYLKTQGLVTYDAIQVLIEWSGGFVSTLITNWIDPNSSSAMSNQMIKVVGTEGRMESNQTERGVRLVTDSRGVEDINPYFSQQYLGLDGKTKEFRGYGIDSISQFIKDVQAILDGQISPSDLTGLRPTFRDSLVSTAVVEGVALSLKNNSDWVTFDTELQPSLSK